MGFNGNYLKLDIYDKEKELSREEMKEIVKLTFHISKTHSLHPELRRTVFNYYKDFGFQIRILHPRNEKDNLPPIFFGKKTGYRREIIYDKGEFKCSNRKWFLEKMIIPPEKNLSILILGIRNENPTAFSLEEISETLYWSIMIAKGFAGYAGWRVIEEGRKIDMFAGFNIKILIPKRAGTLPPILDRRR